MPKGVTAAARSLPLREQVATPARVLDFGPGRPNQGGHDREPCGFDIAHNADGLAEPVGQMIDVTGGEIGAVDVERDE
jgi:hypothetical protein